MGCSFMGLECKVYMVKVSYNQKPYRRILMETFGAKVVPSPSPDTEIGRNILAEDPDSPGSLGIAISEACEDAFSRDDTFYSLGSVLNHVLMHQTVIGMEAKQADGDGRGRTPTSSSAASAAAATSPACSCPSSPTSSRDKKIQVIAVEPEACPTVTKGPYAWDYGDVAGMAPIAKMYTLGHSFVPPPVHAGGLRYHGMAPIVSHCQKLGLIETRAVAQLAVFQSARRSSPAPRASSPRPSRPTPSRWSSTRPSSARSPGRRRPSSWRCPVTGTSTWVPTMPISAAS